MSNPLDTVSQARPGDTVYMSLRGPHTEEELESTKREMESEYPGVNFVISCNDDSISVRINNG